MKKEWLWYSLCVIVPHIMLVVGLVLLSRSDAAKKLLGKRLCLVSTAVLIIGSICYYLVFTPMFGLD